MFQRMMTMIFEKVFNHYRRLTLCYIDDVNIATETLDDHLVRLREVFPCLRDAGLKLKHGLKESMKYQGRVIDKTDTCPDPD